MQRAAAGLARRCVLLLGRHGGVYGAEVFLLVGSGDNGGDTLYAGARLAARGARVRALLLSPDRVHLAGLAALRQAGGFTVRDLPDRADLVLDGIVGIGASGGLRPDAAAIVGTLAGLRGRRGQRAAGGRGGRAERRRRGHRRRARRRGDRGRDRDLRLPEARARGGSGRDPGRAGRAGRHRARRDAARRSGDPGAGRRRHRRLVAAARTGFRQVHPGCRRRRDRLRALSRRRRAVGGRGAAPARPAWSGTRAAPTRTSCGPIRPWWPSPRVADAGRVQAWVCGSGLGTDDNARTELRTRARHLAAGPAGRRRADPAGRRPARRGSAPGRAAGDHAARR